MNARNILWFGLCLLAGFGAGAWILDVLQGIGLPRDVLHSLLPYEGAAAVGLLVALGLASWRARWLRSLLVHAAIALVVAAITIDLTLLLDPRALDRGNFPSWNAALCSSGAVVWILAFVTERFGGRRIGTFTALLLGLAIAAASLQNGDRLHQTLSGDRVRSWNVFHYYVGAKYFAELGYFDLYGATLAADDDWQRVKKKAKGKRRRRLNRVKDFKPIKRARNQRTGSNEPRKKIVKNFDRSIISKERLKELGKDTRFLRKYLGMGGGGRSGWRNTLQDLGFNPAPGWLVIGQPLSSLIPTKFPVFWVISNSDVPVYLLSFLMVWWAFGIRTAALMMLWLNCIQINESRFTGGFLQYDWLASCLCCIALYHRGWYRSAGVALSWGVMSRIFPGVIAAGIGLKLLIDLLGLGNKELSTGVGPLHRGALGRIRPAHWNFLLALTVSCGLLFAASHLTGRGLKTWPEWAQKIEKHTRYHPVTSNMRIGVGRLAQHSPTKKKFWSAHRGSRSQKLEKGRDKTILLRVIGLLLLVPALVRRRDIDSMSLMLFAVFLLTVSSRYYASSWAMLFTLGAGASALRAPIERTDHISGLLAGVVMLVAAATFWAWPDKTISYFVLNYTMYCLFVLLCIGYLLSDLRAWKKSRGSP